MRVGMVVVVGGSCLWLYNPGWEVHVFKVLKVTPGDEFCVGRLRGGSKTVVFGGFYFYCWVFFGGEGGRGVLCGIQLWGLWSH